MCGIAFQRNLAGESDAVPTWTRERWRESRFETSMDGYCEFSLMFLSLSLYDIRFSFFIHLLSYPLSSHIHKRGSENTSERVRQY